MIKKLIVGGWLATAGMTLYDVFRKREDGEAIWSGVTKVMKDNFSLDKVDEKIVKGVIVACVILGAPAFAVLKVIALIRRVLPAFC